MAKTYYDLSQIEQFIGTTWPRSKKRAKTARDFYHLSVAFMCYGICRATPEQTVNAWFPISQDQLRRKIPRVTNSAGKKEYAFDKLNQAFPMFTTISRGSNISKEQTVVKSNIPLDILLSGDNEKEILEEAFADVFAMKYNPHVEVDCAPIDVRNLDNYIRKTKVEAEMHKTSKPRLYNKLTANIHVATLIKLAAEFFPDNKLPMVVNESAFGRKYYKGVNLQSCSKVVRYAALGPVWEVDISNSVFNWKYAKINELYPETSSLLTYTREYLESKTRKEQIRKRLATIVFGYENDEQLKRSVDTIKQVMTAIGFGAQMNTQARYKDANGEWCASSINSIIKSPELRKKLFEDEWMKGFIEEQKAINSILGEYARKYFDEYPALKKGLMNENNTRLDIKRAVSMLYQRDERSMIEHLTKVAQDSNPNIQRVLLVHDGAYFNSKPDVDSMTSELQLIWPTAQLDVKQVEKWNAPYDDTPNQTFKEHIAQQELLAQQYVGHFAKPAQDEPTYEEKQKRKLEKMFEDSEEESKMPKEIRELLEHSKRNKTVIDSPRQSSDVDYSNHVLDTINARTKQ